MDDNLDFTNVFTTEEINAVESFIVSITPELELLGESGELEINWDNKKIIARSDDGQIKEFDFKHILKYLESSLH